MITFLPRTRISPWSESFISLISVGLPIEPSLKPPGRFALPPPVVSVMPQTSYMSTPSA